MFINNQMREIFFSKDRRECIMFSTSKYQNYSGIFCQQNLLIVNTYDRINVHFIKHFSPSEFNT